MKFEQKGFHEQVLPNCSHHENNGQGLIMAR